MLQVIIRADAALSLGTGHIMRCRTLANALRRTLGANTLFVCRAFDGHLADLLEQDGHAVALLPASATPAAGSTDYREWLGAAIDDDVTETRAAITAFRQPGSTLLLITDHYGIDNNCVMTSTWSSPLMTWPIDRWTATCCSIPPTVASLRTTRHTSRQAPGCLSAASTHCCATNSTCPPTRYAAHAVMHASASACW